jgi:arylsulfatase
MWDDVEAFLEDAPEPFFLWVLLIDTHHPYYAPADHHEWPQPGIRRTYATNYVMRRHPGLVGERRPSVVNAYDNTIRYADAFLERLDETLEREGYGDDPLIVHSDHGDELGEHAPEPYGHRPLMYDTVTRVPLVMKNVGETGRVEGPNTLLDLSSTILDLVGSDVRPGDRPSLLGEECDHDHVVVQNRVDEDEWMVAVVGDGWKLLHHPGQDSVAFYRPSDPFEKDDRWGDHPDHLESALEERLAELSRLVGDASDENEDDERVDADVQERLADLGYLN